MGTVGKYMSKEVVEVPSDATLREAADQMRQKGVTSLMVTEGGKHVGILTEADLARRAIPEGQETATCKVMAVMTAGFQTVETSTSINEANEIMKNSKIRHLPVMENGKLVGMITMLGLLRYYVSLAKSNE